MNNQKVIIFVDVHFNRYLSKSVLGKIFSINIAEIPMLLHFPGLPLEWEDLSKTDHLHYPLSAPEISKRYKYGDEDILYGFPHSYPTGSSIVEKVVLSFEITEEEIEEKNNIIRKEVEKVMNIFHKLFYIVNESVNPTAIVKQSDCRIDLYNDSTGNRIKNQDEIEIIGYMHDDMNSISKKQLEIMLGIINRKINIPIEYDFLISAIRAYEHHDYRKCILDLSTACEISITSKIEELQSNLDIKNILEDYKTLAAKYRLLGLLNYDTSFADISVITNVRNKAIHKGQQIDSKQAYEAIKVTRTILKRLSIFY